MINYHSSICSCEIKAWEKNVLAGTGSTTMASDTGAVLYQLSYQANRELVTLWVCYITADGEDASKYNEVMCI